jgi:hypothetical protein
LIGWDPVTGWGSITYDKLMLMFNASYSDDDDYFYDDDYVDGSSHHSDSNSSGSTLIAVAIILIVCSVAFLIIFVYQYFIKENTRQGRSSVRGDIREPIIHGQHRRSSRERPRPSQPVTSSTIPIQTTAFSPQAQTVTVPFHEV